MSDFRDSIKYPWFLLLWNKENLFNNILIKYDSNPADIWFYKM